MGTQVGTPTWVSDPALLANLVQENCPDIYSRVGLPCPIGMCLWERMQAPLPGLLTALGTCESGNIIKSQGTSSRDLTACRPGDGALPNQYVPMGTQVGTPAWVPDSADTDVDVAKNWFIIIMGSKLRRPLAREHVHVDTAGTNSVHSTWGKQVSGYSSQSVLSLGVAGTQPSCAFSALHCTHGKVSQQSGYSQVLQVV